MVGIVLVSHSAELAEAVAALAREMGGPDIVIEVAGGTRLAADALGTDALLVMAAIEASLGLGGVLVLMDLGSALLSAETALEMLGPDIAAQVVLSDAPFVEGAVSAAVAARAGLSLAEVAAEARAGLAGKRAHLGTPAAEPGRGAPPPAWPAADDEATVVVGNPLGLHARPAARIVATAGRYDAEVTITNVTAGRGPASGRSINAVSTLGARVGHELHIMARGPEAAAVVAALVALAGDGLGFGDGEAPIAPTPGPGLVAGATYSGLPASPGIASGLARHLRPVVPPVPVGPGAGPAAEWDALWRALVATRHDLGRARTALAAVVGEDRAAILDAHLLYLDDEALLGPARQAVLTAGVNGAQAWHEAVMSMAGAYRSLDDPYLQGRAADVVDVGNRVLVHLLGPGRAGERVTEAGIVVVTELSPGDLAGLDPAFVVGLAAATGGPLGHGALVARALGIPAVVGLGAGVLTIAEGAPLVLDGDTGALFVDPTPEVGALLAARGADARRRQAGARAAAGAVAVTRDGLRVLVEANAGSAHEAAAIVASGADGVGLLRTEFLFLDRDTAPDEDEQYRAYLELAVGLEGRPLVVRTLDAGADKPVAWLPADGRHEANPALGLRGLRLGLARPELLATQIRAVLRVAVDHPVRIMFPMVTTVDEVRRSRALIAEAMAAMADEGRAVPARMKVGIMVEVPAAALAAAHLAGEVDFLSIGTNDLTQYAMAADRTNAAVAGLGDALDPAVLGLVHMVAVAGADVGARVGVCGALAADVLAVPVLVGLGITELSVPPAAVAGVKQAVREVDSGRALVLAQEALTLGTAAEVRRLLAAGATR